MTWPPAALAAARPMSRPVLPAGLVAGSPRRNGKAAFLKRHAITEVLPG